MAEPAGEGESASFSYANEQAAAAGLRTEEQFREEQERLDAERARLRMQKGIPVKKKCVSFASWKKIRHSDGRIGGHIRRG